MNQQQDKAVHEAVGALLGIANRLLAIAPDHPLTKQETTLARACDSTARLAEKVARELGAAFGIEVP